MGIREVLWLWWYWYCGRFAEGPMGKEHVEMLSVAKEDAVIWGWWWDWVMERHDEFEVYWGIRGCLILLEREEGCWLSGIWDVRAKMRGGSHKGITGVQFWICWFQDAHVLLTWCLLGNWRSKEGLRKVLLADDTHLGQQRISYRKIYGNGMSLPGMNLSNRTRMGQGWCRCF